VATLHREKKIKTRSLEYLKARAAKEISQYEEELKKMDDELNDLLEVEAMRAGY
jgi:hypothetical protein